MLRTKQQLVHVHDKDKTTISTCTW